MDIPFFSIINILRTFIKWDEVKRRILFFNRWLSPVKVVIYGESGVGKTQFINAITMSHKYSKDRTRDVIGGHYLELSNFRRVELIDTPGQSSYKQKRSSLMDLFKNGYLAKPETREHEAFKAGTDMVKPRFLRDNRQLELRQAKEMIKLVSDSKNVKWVMHVMNKADLWYTDEQTVKEYYELKEYRVEVIDKISANCKWTLLPFCSNMTGFLRHQLPHAIDEEAKGVFHEKLINELEELVLNKKNGTS